jgi:predicted DNA binding CopG/RHH family protein
LGDWWHARRGCAAWAQAHLTRLDDAAPRHRPAEAARRRESARSRSLIGRTRYSRYAKATFRKDRRLNTRLSSKDLEAIQERALAEGLPYQTLIASLLHKYATGRLKEI